MGRKDCRGVGLVMILEKDKFVDSEYPLGWIATRCSCGAELVYEMEHVYGENDSPGSMTHGECPNCNIVMNVKIEVWEAK